MTNGAIETTLWPGMHALEPSSQLGGIMARKPGYHNSRDHLPASDYSVREFAIDRVGPADLGSAIDWTFPEAQSESYGRIDRYSSRLLAAGRAVDPRTYGMREFFGQADSDSAVEGWDFSKNRTSTSDKSHLWHIHISIHRKYINDTRAMRAVLSILSGQSLAAWNEQENPVATQFNADDLAAIRLQSQLGVYDAFARASAASDATPGGDDATGRQIRDFFNNMFDFSSDIGPLADSITALGLKVDTVDENTAGLVKDPADGGPSAQQQNLKTALS
jgi:hypothetical protein